MTLVLFILMNVAGPAYLGYAGYSAAAMLVLAFTIAAYKVARGWRVEEGASLRASIVRGYLFSALVAAPPFFIARLAAGAP